MNDSDARSTAEVQPSRERVIGLLEQSVTELDQLDEPMAAIHVQWAIDILTDA